MSLNQFELLTASLVDGDETGASCFLGRATQRKNQAEQGATLPPAVCDRESRCIREYSLTRVVDRSKRRCPKHSEILQLLQNKLVFVNRIS